MPRISKPTICSASSSHKVSTIHRTTFRICCRAVSECRIANTTFRTRRRWRSCASSTRLTLHAVDHSAGFLPKAFVDEGFSFYGKALNGTPELRARWQRGADFTSTALGEVVGKLYVQRFFPPEAKAKVKAMVDDLEKAFG